jgi:hypothetical protein
MIEPMRQPTSPSYHDNLNSLIGQSMTPFPPDLAVALDFMPGWVIGDLCKWVESERQAARDLPRGRPDCPQCGRLLAECSCTDL